MVAVYNKLYTATNKLEADLQLFFKILHLQKNIDVKSVLHLLWWMLNSFAERYWCSFINARLLAGMPNLTKVMDFYGILAQNGSKGIKRSIKRYVVGRHALAKSILHQFSPKCRPLIGCLKNDNVKLTTFFLMIWKRVHVHCLRNECFEKNYTFQNEKP